MERAGASRERILRPRDTVNRDRDGRMRVVLEMPGVGRDGLEVKIENNELRIRGRRQPGGGPEGKYLLRERPLGDYQMIYTLDETVDTSKVDAVLEKGILTLSLELKEAVKPRTIPVRAG